MNALRPNRLNFIELLAQNIALISPTMTAALIVPLMFGTTGSISWLAYAVGTLMLLFVALSLNQFAKRTTMAGSMYNYASSGLGFAGGAMCGWCLVWAYLFIGLAGTTGFTIFASKLLEAIHIQAPPVALFAVCLGVCFLLAYKDIKISTLVMLGFEGFSCLMIFGLCLIVLGHHHFALDASQFSFKGSSLTTLGMGAVVAIFSLVGFESSTAFGEESINPLKTIPRSIIWSLLLTGAFFIFVCYTEVLGTAGYKDSLDKIDAPLNVLAQMYNVPFLWPLLSAGAMFSFFALAASCMNAGARVMFAMGRHDFFHKSTSLAHERHGTPHVALAAMAIIMFAVVRLQICLQTGSARRVQRCRHDGRIRFPGRLYPHHAGGTAVPKENRGAQDQGHRPVRGGHAAAADSHRGQRLPRAGGAGQCLPLHLRGVPLLRLFADHGDAASKAAAAHGNSRGSAKGPIRNRLDQVRSKNRRRRSAAPLPGEVDAGGRTQCDAGWMRRDSKATGVCLVGRLYLRIRPQTFW
jgi:amino acid transporter